MFYYIFSYSWAYYLMSDKKYMPWWLGGPADGDYDLSYVDHPYQKHDPMLENYMLVTMGFHVASFIEHLIPPHRNDFVEMALHHIVTFFLYATCHMVNITEAGALTAMMHDFADIGINMSRVFAETVPTMSAITFALTMLAWLWSRMICYPYSIYLLAVSHVNMGSIVGKPFIIYLLSALVILHYYWFGLFCKIMGKFL